MANDSISIKIEADSSGANREIAQIEGKSAEAAKVLGESISKALSDRLNASFDTLNANLSAINENLKGTTKEASSGFSGILNAVTLSSVGTKAFNSITQQSAQILTGLSAAAVKTSDNFFTMQAKLTGLSGALIALGHTMTSTDNVFFDFFGTITTITGVLLGLGTIVTTKIITSFGALTNQIGTKLVASFVEASDSFVKAEKQLLVFTKIIENYNILTNKSSGTTEEWTLQIDSLSKSLNVSQIELAKASAEIVQVGSKLGFTRDELFKLTKISAEYAKINGKDVFDVSVAIVGALNGNAQAVQNLGIKLTEASVSAFAYRTGLQQSFEKLSDSEKAQFRYNALLKQYQGIAGIAAQTSDTLAEQNEKLRLSQEKLAILFGQGASYIEENNVVAFALNKAISSLNETFIKTLGFFGALGARILQVGGYIVEHSFYIFALYKGYTLLNSALASRAFEYFLVRPLPLINTSLSQMITQIAGAQVQLNSFSSLLKTLGQIASNQAGLLVRFLFGMAPDQSITAFSLISGLLGRIATAFVGALTTIGAALTAIGPQLLIIVGISAAIYALWETIKLIEERTGAFSKFAEAFKIAFNEMANALSPLGELLNSFLLSVQKLVNQGLGLLAFGLSTVFSKILDLVKTNPFGVFSSKSIAAISSAQASLASFNKELESVGFNIGELSKKSDDLKNKLPIQNPFNIEDLNRLREELKDIGKTDLQIVSETQQNRLNIINAALRNELISRAEYASLRERILLDASIKEEEIATKDLERRKREAQEFANALRGLNNLIVGTIQRIGASLARGGDAFSDFKGFVLNTIGDMAIQIGSTLIAIGTGIDALAISLKTLSGGVAIAAGIALIAVGGLLKSMSGGIGAGVPGATGPGGGIAGPITTIPAPEVQLPEETARPRTEVVVNIEGNVLDRRETGLAIVEVLNEYFDTNDGVLARA